MDLTSLAILTVCVVSAVGLFEFYTNKRADKNNKKKKQRASQII